MLVEKGIPWLKDFFYTSVSPQQLVPAIVLPFFTGIRSSPQLLTLRTERTHIKIQSNQRVRSMDIQWVPLP
jgi:hypothetical protein